MSRPSPQVLLAIDAGGSSTRARALRDGEVVFEGSGGPGNPLATNQETLDATFESALKGCPTPLIIGACVAGAGSERGRRTVSALLGRRFPSARVEVVPDYVAAFLAGGTKAHVAVIAGTGSVICSTSADGWFDVSGGRGWILGDHGSAARLGQRFLDHFIAARDPDVVRWGGQVEEALGTARWRELVATVHGSDRPASVLAKAAPLLTAAATDGIDWALDALTTEITVLAKDTSLHVSRYMPGQRPPVMLSGGVWASAVARRVYEQALADEQPDLSVLHVKAPPIEGAVTFARGLTG